MTFMKHILALISIGIIFPLSAYQISVGTYVMNDGHTVTVPVALDNAAGLSYAGASLTYDPQVLVVTKIEKGTLKSAMSEDFASTDTNGIVSVAIFGSPEENVVSASGTIANITFAVREGTQGHYSDITISSVDIGDKSGVRDVTAENPIRTQSGMVRVMRSDAAVQRLEGAQIVVADTSLGSLSLKEGDVIQASSAQTPIVVASTVTGLETIPVEAPVDGWLNGRYALLKTTTEGLSFKLQDVEDVVYSQETTDGVTTYYATIDNEVGMQMNEWIIEPTISHSSWIEGEEAGELTFGVAKFGEVTATINGVIFTDLPTEPGVYTLEYTVAQTDSYSGLTKLITFEILKKPIFIPTINPDWGYVVTDLGKNKNEVAIVFTNHTEKAMLWTVPVNLENVQLLVVGGGGGGGADNYAGDARQGGAGGGGGGVITGTIAKLDKESKITITVGGGGAGGMASKTNSGKYGAGIKGGNSIININNTDIVVANGGGCDMGANSAYGYTNGNAGGSGGSGGAGRPNKLGGVANPGTVVESYLLNYQMLGNNGGDGCKIANGGYGSGAAGGGGGAMEAGYPGTKVDDWRGGDGGEGLASDITGTLLVYGSGGGGSSTWGAAGAGGTGAGDGVYGGNGKPGLANQGGGGGGGSRTSNGGAGGSGIVVLRFVIANDSSLNEVFPEISDDSKVAAALEGSVDSKLVENIKTAAEYAAFREWALKLEGVTPEEVKASPNAWLSYALNADKLIIAAPKEGDVVIDTFEIAATDGSFEFTVKIDGIAVGDNALEANLKKVFDIEGAETLASGGSGFSTDNVEVNIATPVNGNVKFTVTPKMGNGELGMGNGNWEKPDSFFFRVKMK